PVCNVFVDVGPYIPFGEQSSAGSDARMRQVVNLVENVSAAVARNQRSGSRTSSVADDIGVGPGNGERFKFERSVTLKKRFDLSVLLLVNSENLWSDGRGSCDSVTTRESVGHNIVRARDMTNVGREGRDI